MKTKLAELLLRRKELQEKVQELRGIKHDGLFEVKVRRQQVTESVDDIQAMVPKISMQQVTHCFDWHSKRLRLVDAAIQQANWQTEVDIDSDCMSDYIDPFTEKK